MRTADRDRLLAQRAEIIDAAQGALTSGHVSPARRLSRRQRWALLTLRVLADRAVVVAARRGKRAGLTVEAHLFRRQEDAWVWEEVGPSVEYDESTLPPSALDHGYLLRALGQDLAEIEVEPA